MKYTDEYASHEADRNRAYRDAYESPQACSWIASLTPAQRARAEKLGLLKPCLDATPGGTSIETLPCELIPQVDGYKPWEDELPLMLRRRQVNYKELDQHRLDLLTAFFDQSDNPTLLWACLRFLMGQGRCEEHARLLGMSKQNFHYYARHVADSLGISPLGNRVAERARASYRLMNSRRSYGPTNRSNSACPGLRQTVQSSRSDV